MTEQELQAYIQAIVPADRAAMDAAEKRQAELAKPPGSLGELERPPTVKLDEGNACAAFWPKKEALEKGRLVLDVIRRGLEVLGKRYPENVAIYVIGNGEGRGYTEESRAEPADMEPRA